MCTGTKFTICVVTMTLLLACVQVAYAQGTAISGRWVGGFDIEGEWTPVIVGFGDEEDSGYLVQDGRFSTMTAVRLEAPCVRFETASLSFDGGLADGTISGRVARGEKSGDFYLARLATMTTDIYDAYIGNSTVVFWMPWLRTASLKHLTIALLWL